MLILGRDTMSPIAVEVTDCRGMENISPVFSECHNGEHNNFDYDSMDEQIKEAAAKAEREGSTRPIILQELRDKIQLQRMKSGKQELVLEPEPPKVYVLTPEEKVKQQKRKQRNRNAAKQSRIKKKHQHESLQKENKTLTSRRNHLKQKVRQLQDLVETYQKSIRSSRICAEHYSAARHHNFQPKSVMRHEVISKNEATVTNNEIHHSCSLVQGQRQVNGNYQTCILPENAANPIEVEQQHDNNDVTILGVSYPGFDTLFSTVGSFLTSTGVPAYSSPSPPYLETTTTTTGLVASPSVAVANMSGSFVEPPLIVDAQADCVRLEFEQMFPDLLEQSTQLAEEEVRDSSPNTLEFSQESQAGENINLLESHGSQTFVPIHIKQGGLGSGSRRNSPDGMFSNPAYIRYP